MSTMTHPQAPLRAMVAIGAFYFFYFVLIGVYIIYLPKMLTQQGFSATQLGIIYAAAPMMRFLLPFLFRRFLSLDDRVYRLALGLMLISSLLFALTVHSFGSYLLINLLYEINLRVGIDKKFNIVSGYRTPQTNAWLRHQLGGRNVAKNSYHMKGQAVDIYVPGYPLHKLRNIAISLKKGGVGYYPKQGFIHVDVGPVRQWRRG